MKPTEVISREQALATGLGWFFTGLPCSRGHIAKRSTSNQDCRGCVNDRARRYRAEDPERIRERERRAAEGRADVRLEQRRASWARHREKNLQADRARHKASPDRKREAAKLWAKQNPERASANAYQRKKRVRQATPPWLTDEQREEMTLLYIEAKRRPGEWHVDHIIPLAGKGVCGLHVPWNLQIITGDENRRKGVRYDAAA